MAKRKKKNESEILAEIVISGILEKKGKGIVSMDLREVRNSVCNFFVICHGSSKVQVQAIADSVEHEVRTAIGSKPWHKEGVKNAEWILLDYVDVVVHVFHEKSREFYQLENLWGDAEIKHIESEA